MAYFIGGHLGDPDDAASLAGYWDYTTQLKPHLTHATSSGDVDLRPYASPRHDQGQTGSCVAQSVIKSLENLQRQHLCKQQGISPDALPMTAHQDLSVLALYYLCREQMHPSRVNQDTGTFPYLACHCLKVFGVCREKEWPYRTDRVLQSPPIMAMRDAYMHRISGYYRITETGNNRVDRVLEALRANRPVVYGTDIGNNWQTYKKNQILKLPYSSQGGHATHLVGWIANLGVFIGENSWGPGWGDNGCYLLDPEVVASDKSRDFWVITGNWEDLS